MLTSGLPMHVHTHMNIHTQIKKLQASEQDCLASLCHGGHGNLLPDQVPILHMVACATSLQKA